MNINLAAYPDSDSDQTWDGLIGPLNLTLMRQFNEPIRELLPCECGAICIVWIARDHNRPELVFGGTVCPNPECGVLMVSVATDTDGVDEE